ncbi:MAG: hypothetical protein JO199_09650 [Candidatus Eremiobacteraeota bacterium]|nr:hypothetical protein [Candidatus Eremiobacteraeota bacterium]
MGVLSGDRLVRCTIPGQNQPYSVVRSKGTMIVNGWENGSFAGIDPTARSVSWAVSDARAKNYHHLVALPDGTAATYAEDRQPGILRVGPSGLSSLLESPIRYVASSATTAFALGPVHDTGTEIYRWNGGRFQNYVRVDPADYALPVKGDEAVVVYRGHVALMDGKGTLRDAGNWRPGADVTDSIVAPDGDAYATLQYISRYGNPSGGTTLIRISARGTIDEFAVGKPNTALDALAVAPDGTIWIAQYYGQRVIALPPDYPR